MTTNNKNPFPEHVKTAYEQLMNGTGTESTLPVAPLTSPATLPPSTTAPEPKIEPIKVEPIKVESPTLEIPIHIDRPKTPEEKSAETFQTLAKNFPNDKDAQQDLQRLMYGKNGTKIQEKIADKKENIAKFQQKIQTLVAELTMDNRFWENEIKNGNQPSPEVIRNFQQKQEYLKRVRNKINDLANDIVLLQREAAQSLSEKDHQAAVES